MYAPGEMNERKELDSVKGLGTSVGIAVLGVLLGGIVGYLGCVIAGIAPQASLLEERTAAAATVGLSAAVMGGLSFVGAVIWATHSGR
jgi:hypothetical protein